MAWRGTIFFGWQTPEGSLRNPPRTCLRVSLSNETNSVINAAVFAPRRKIWWRIRRIVMPWRCFKVSSVLAGKSSWPKAWSRTHVIRVLHVGRIGSSFVILTNLTSRESVDQDETKTRGRIRRWKWWWLIAGRLYTLLHTTVKFSGKTVVAKYFINTSFFRFLNAARNIVCIGLTWTVVLYSPSIAFTGSRVTLIFIYGRKMSNRSETVLCSKLFFFF